MEYVDSIPLKYYVQLKQIVTKYLPGTSDIHLEQMYNECPNAFTGYYIDDVLIGVCYGCKIDTSYFQLDGIAIIHPYNAYGRGKRLLEYFESSILKLGYRYISLGSAGGYVERFYIKNGYTPIDLKILTKNNDWNRLSNDSKYPISYVQTQEQYIKLVIKVINYDKMDRIEIMQYYNGVDAFFIFEKDLMPAPSV